MHGGVDVVGRDFYGLGALQGVAGAPTIWLSFNNRSLLPHGRSTRCVVSSSRPLTINCSASTS
jgi:hypothetical protein